MTRVVFVKPNKDEVAGDWDEAPLTGDTVILKDQAPPKWWRVIRRTWEDGRCYVSLAEIDAGYDSRNRPA